MTAAPRVVVRRDAERGHLRNAWLEARLSFSFGDWHSPGWSRFGRLLALNEDRVQPLRGFDMHSHEHLDILMLPLTAPISHADSLGGRDLVLPGEAQLIQAGSGIRHSQLNADAQRVDHHFQLWFEPMDWRIQARVHKARLQPPRAGRWVPVVGPRGGPAPLCFDSNTEVMIGTVSAHQTLSLAADEVHALYLHVATGEVDVLGGADAPHSNSRLRLSAGDAWAEFDGNSPMMLQSDGDATLLAVRVARP
jgi:redox-sensitive bicupin YhaK (pirin superfamily)